MILLQSLLFSLLLSVQAVASPLSSAISKSAPVCGIQSEKAGFVPAEAGLREIGMAIELMKTAVHLTLKSEKSSAQCSGAMVSDDGYLLTARHCLDDCVASLGTAAPNKKCELTVNGRQVEYEFEVAGPCRYEDIRDARVKHHAKKEALPPEQRACLIAGDLALLKIKNPGQDFRCSPISTEPVAQEGARVLAIGFPPSTSRVGENPDAEDSTGVGAHLSTGETIKEDFCAAFDLENGIWRRRVLGEDFRRQKELMLQTTVDIVQGVSGAGLYNQRGEIVGVASAFDPNVHGFEKECKGATLFERVTRLQLTARSAGKPNFEMSKIVCKEKRATKRRP